MRHLALLSLLLVGCGSAEDFVKALQNQTATPTATPTSSPVTETTTKMTMTTTTSMTYETKTVGKVEEMPVSGNTPVVASIKKLPDCAVENEGMLVYVKNLDKFVLCQDEKWMDISNKGKQEEKNIGVVEEKITNTFEMVCPNGGINYHFFYDYDNDGRFSNGDEFFSQTPVCNIEDEAND